ncbi:MAG: winged helix-turn-helix domain-containing protein [Thermoplasmata archaeon]
MWDGILLKRYLLDKYNIDLEVRQRQNIFHKLGFRLRRPRPMIVKGDQDLKDDFKKTPE